MLAEKSVLAALRGARRRDGYLAQPSCECLALVSSACPALAVDGPSSQHRRGPTRILTEIPVRILYVLVQGLCEVLDRLFFDPREVLSHLVVARRIA